MLKRLFIVLLLLPIAITANGGEPLDKVVAVINDNVITTSELDAQTNISRQQILAKKMTPPSDTILRKQVLQHLINVELQLQLAKNNNMSIDDVELNDAIGKIASSNNLTITQLREALKKQGMDWQSYRDNIRKEMLISRVQQMAVSQDLAISSQQVDDYLKTARKNVKNQQTYHLQNIIIPLPEEPTSQQVKRAQHKADNLLKKIKDGHDFSGLAISESSGEYALEGGDLGERHLAELPEVFAEKVITMKQGDVSDPIRTGNGYQLIKLIAIGKKQKPHKIRKSHVRHILFKQDTNMTEAEAKKQAENIYQQLKSGKDFAKMAKQYSLDSASAVNGGDLGWVTADELVPQFSKSMNELPLHTVSHPVKSPFGWHLIEVLDRKTVDDSDAYERQQVRQFLHQRKFTEAVQNWLQHMRTDAYVNVLEKKLA